MKKLILLPVKVLILGLILISALPAFATTYYVRTVGNDSNGGTTKNTAFKTITKAITVSIPGDTVYIGSGTYNKALSVESKAGTSNSQINIVGDTTGAFTGDSAGEIIVTSLETAPAGSYTLVPGKNFTWFGAASNQWGYMIGQNYNGDLRLLNQINSTDATCTGEVENVEGSWTVFGGKFYVHAYGGGNPGNSTIYTATSRNLMTISNSTYINVSGLTFKAGGCGIAITGATTGHLNLFKLNFDYLANAIRFDGNANSQTNIHDSVFSNLIRYPNVAIAGTESLGIFENGDIGGINIYSNIFYRIWIPVVVLFQPMNVFDNCFYMDGTPGYPNDITFAIGTSIESTASRFDHNAFYRGNNGCTALLAEFNGENFTSVETLSQWQGVLGQDLHSYEAPTTVIPFRNPSARNFRSLPGALLIGSGTSEVNGIFASTQDADGVVRPQAGGRYDVGAYEYVASGLITNPTTIAAYSSASKTTDITAFNGLYQSTANRPYFEWSGARSDVGTITGYALTWDASSTADPGMAVNYTATNFQAPLSATQDVKYLRIRTFDDQGFSTEAQTLFAFKYSPTSGGPTIYPKASGGLIATGGNLPVQPSFEVDVTSGNSVDLNSFRFTFSALANPLLVTDFVTTEITNGYRFTYLYPGLLAVGTYAITIEANTQAEVRTTLEAFNLRVRSGVATVPTVEGISLNGSPAHSGDVISPLPTVEANFLDDSIISLDNSKIFIDGVAVDNSLVSATVVDNGYRVKYSMTSPLSTGVHSIAFEAVNNWGRVADATLSMLEVKPTNTGGISGPVINYPNPFSSLRGETTQIRYALNSNADVKVYVFDLVGRLVWQRTYLSGTSGGMAGFNSVVFDGQSDMGGSLPNGVYFVKVTSGGAVWGSCKIVLLN